MGSFNQVFGGTAIKPSDVQYLALTFAANTTLVWPLESVGGATYVAAQIDAIASAGSLSLIMPPANQGSTGIATMITNVGSNTFTVKDNGGNVIVTIAAGITWIISLIDNTTVNGSWRAYQLAATTSSANAAALAGNGLQAFAGKLQSVINTSYKGGNYSIVSADRATGFVYNGVGAATFQLDTIANLTPGWWCLVENRGTGALAITCSGGETINGGASISLAVGVAPQQVYSVLIVCSSTGFNAFFQVPSPMPVANGGTGASDAGTALQNLGGSPIGITIFEAASSAIILAALGVSQSLLTEASVSANQVLTSTSGNQVFVATAAISITMPEADTLTTSFFFMVYAQGGNVTLTPHVGDKINGQAAGVTLVIPAGTSALVVTDAAAVPGNWWVLFQTRGQALVNNVGAQFIASGVTNTVTIAAPVSYRNYNVTVSFTGQMDNINGTTISPIITIKVKDGASVVVQKDFTVTVPIDFNQILSFTFGFTVPQPSGSNNFTITATDTEADGGSHVWVGSTLAASVAGISPL